MRQARGATSSCHVRRYLSREIWCQPSSTSWGFWSASSSSRGVTTRAARELERCGGRCVLFGGRLTEIYLCNVCSCQKY
jgi:hypothetical protein